MPVAEPLPAPATALLKRLGRAPLQISDLPDEDQLGRYELIDGGLIVTPLGDMGHRALVGRLYGRLAALAPQHLEVLPGVNVISGESTLVMPDVAVVDPGCAVHHQLGVSPAGLILAVEITSPSTRRHDLTLKRDLYREWGVPLLIVDRGRTPRAVIVAGELPPWAEDLDTD